MVTDTNIRIDTRDGAVYLILSTGNQDNIFTLTPELAKQLAWQMRASGINAKLPSGK